MANWGYRDKNGPDNWGKWFRLARKPRYGQSPIDIQREECIPGKFRRLRLKYHRNRCLTLNNSGHSFQLNFAVPDDLSDLKDYSLRNGPILDGDRFVLCQLHFHWGCNDDEGSEHTVNGRSYAAECHLVHFNTKYGSFREAQDKHDGLVVLAVFFKAGRSTRGVQRLVDHFGDIAHKGRKVDVTYFHPKWIIPKNIFRQRWWTYKGSLTTPPLHESVTWIIFQWPMHMSPEQLEQMRQLKGYCPNCNKPDSDDEYEGRIFRNFRKRQERNFHGWGDDNEEMDVERNVWTYKRRRPLLGGAWQKDEEDPESSSSSSSCSEDDEDSSDLSADEDSD